MIWKKISIDTSLEAVDLISEFLDEQGIEGIMIEDNQPLTEDEIREMFVDIPLVGDASDDSAVVSFFIDSSYTDKMIDDLADKIRAELKRLSEFIPVGTMNIDMTETSDDSTWNDNFKNFFKPQRLYGNLVIMPVYDDDMNSDSNNIENNDLKDFDIKEDDNVIKIRSVMAFGTGTHETTRLCLGLIKKHINDMSTIKKDLTLMDVGCGSGILSIASV
ncbi:MAG: 50S ribosomal protein L11 methyltransferase, partial [Butyrivibrio sp.]|nr:50S ribosomal protein L11 methyltransferase [Butyrivibrio sp.]